MFTPAEVRLLADMTQRECSLGVRIAARLLAEGKSLTEKSLKGVLKVKDLPWEEAKPSLTSVLLFKAGRVDFLTDDNRPDPWDTATPEELAKIDESWKKQVAKKNVVLTDIEIRIHALGGLTEPEARTLFYRMKNTYGHDAIVSALDRIGSKKPNDPKAYLQTVLKGMMAEAAKTGGSGTRPEARSNRIPNFVKPSGAGMGKTEYKGWEAPAAFDKDGAPVWSSGQRRKIYRLGNGYIAFEKPDLADHIPTIEEDAGWSIT